MENNVSDILRRAIEWWLQEGHDKFYGAPEWVFAARLELERQEKKNHE